MSRPDELRPWLYRLACDLLNIWSRVWFRLELKGKDRIPARGACLVCANHVSYLDPPVLACGVRHRVIRFLAKEALFRSRWFGAFMRAVGTLPVGREQGDAAVLKRTLRHLQDGYCIGMFPEGQRSPDGNLMEAKGGIGFLIARSGVPVIPAYIDGTYRAWPRGGRFIRPAKVRVAYGAPITPDEVAGFGRGREAYDRLGALVMDRIRALRDAAQAGGGPADAGQARASGSSAR